MVHVYAHIDLVLLVFMKSGTFCTKTSTFYKKHMKSNKNSWFKQISHYDLVFCRVQREGQLDISYSLVVFGGVCGACMFKWYMYTHILTWYCWFSWKVVLFIWKLVLFVKNTWKHWKLKSTWKVKSTPEKWEAPEKWKAHESTWKLKSTWKTYLKSESIWKVKSTWKTHEKWKAPLFIKAYDFHYEL